MENAHRPIWCEKGARRSENGKRQISDSGRSTSVSFCSRLFLAHPDRAHPIPVLRSARSMGFE
jgi:hypothetical protein